MPLLRLYHITGQIGWFTNTPKPGEDYTGTCNVDEKLWAQGRRDAGDVWGKDTHQDGCEAERMEEV